MSAGCFRVYIGQNLMNYGYKCVVVVGQEFCLELVPMLLRVRAVLLLLLVVVVVVVVVLLLLKMC